MWVTLGSAPDRFKVHFHDVFGDQFDRWGGPWRQRQPRFRLSGLGVAAARRCRPGTRTGAGPPVGPAGGRPLGPSRRRHEAAVQPGTCRGSRGVARAGNRGLRAADRRGLSAQRSGRGNLGQRRSSSCGAFRTGSGAAHAGRAGGLPARRPRPLPLPSRRVGRHPAGGARPVAAQFAGVSRSARPAGAAGGAGRTAGPAARGGGRSRAARGLLGSGAGDDAARLRTPRARPCLGRGGGPGEPGARVAVRGDGSGRDLAAARRGGAGPGAAATLRRARRGDHAGAPVPHRNRLLRGALAASCSTGHARRTP